MRQFTTVLIAALLAAACGGEPPEPPPTPTPETLTEHGEEFREDVVEVTEGVYVAIGFGIANSILIEGEDAAIVVDVMESLEAAERIAERFRAITDKPVKALVYTHSHPDHIHGGAAFVDPDDPSNDYKSAITCINARYNHRGFNDGYHISHHLVANRHWTDHPAELQENLQAYVDNDAIIFEGIDFFMVWLLSLIHI